MGPARAARTPGQNVCGPQNLTVAILAQGTHWAAAQPLFVAGSISASGIVSVGATACLDRASRQAHMAEYTKTKVCTKFVMGMGSMEDRVDLNVAERGFDPRTFGL